MVGTFYAAASPGAEPLVKIGQDVKVGDPLGVIEAMKTTLGAIAPTDTADKTAGALVIDAELIAGIDSPGEIATARRMQQLRWLSERRQLPTAPDAKITAIRTLLGAFNATGAKITLGERERLTRAIEAVGAA